jgi:hypothetical protein
MNPIEAVANRQRTHTRSEISKCKLARINQPYRVVYYLANRGKCSLDRHAPGGRQFNSRLLSMNANNCRWQLNMVHEFHGPARSDCEVQSLEARSGWIHSPLDCIKFALAEQR